MAPRFRDRQHEHFILNKLGTTFLSRKNTIGSSDKLVTGQVVFAGREADSQQR